MILVYRTQSRDRQALVGPDIMPFWIHRAASKIFNIARFHGQAECCPLPHLLPQDDAFIWFTKVVYTLCYRSSKTPFGIFDSDYFRKNLNPLIAFSVIKHLSCNFVNPRLAFSFFYFTRINLNLAHSFETYNLMLRTICRTGIHDMTKVIFEFMRMDGFWPDNSNAVFLLECFANAENFEIARELLVAQAGLNFDDEKKIRYIYNKLLSLLVKQHRVLEAVDFFEEHTLRLQKLAPDTCTFNILISGLCRLEEFDKAFGIFNSMGSFGCLPEVRTYTSLISGYCKLGRMVDASNLFDEMSCCGIHPNTHTYNVLIDGFGKLGNMASAMVTYAKMACSGCAPDCITFTSLIDGHCRIGEVDQGLKFWNEMNARNVFPNEYTFCVVIHGLCKVNRINEARDLLWQLFQRKDIYPKPFICNPVIDGFCKAGNVDEANLIVIKMEEKGCNLDKMTFTILILGHCMKGRMPDALRIFNKMLAVGCKPDAFTISSFESCLLKAGMPKEAFRIKQTALEHLTPGMPSFRRTIHCREGIDVPMAL